MSEQAHNRTEAAIRFRDEITKLLGLIEFLWTNFSVLDVVAKGFAQFLIQLPAEMRPDAIQSEHIASAIKFLEDGSGGPLSELKKQLPTVFQLV